MIGPVVNFPKESDAREEVERRRLHHHLKQPNFTGRVTFGNLAQHYIRHELGEQADMVMPKSGSTIERYLQILNNPKVLDNTNVGLIPRWGERVALDIEVLEIEEWLKAVKRVSQFKNPTMDKIRRVMNLVYKHSQRHGLIPRGVESNPVKLVRCAVKSNYKAITIQPEQAFAILNLLPRPERTLTLLIAATGLRISECLGLRWDDVDFAGQQIHVRRTWTGGQVGNPKTETSAGVVPLHPVLAGYMQEWKKQTVYAQPTDWVFASARLKGKKPRVANMLVEDYLRPAAVKIGVLKEGEQVRFGFHNLRHSLASYLVRTKHDPKTVQDMLRHSDVKTTLGIYTQTMSEDRLLAQGEMLKAIFPETVN